MTTFNKFIWILIIGLVVICLSSCSSPKKLFQQGINKIEKAIKKDPSLKIPSDTIRITTIDTIKGADGRDSIIRIKEFVEVPCDFDIEAIQNVLKEKSRKELRFERKTSKDSLKHMEKMYKLETKRLEDSLAFQKKLNKELTKQIEDSNTTLEKLAKEKTKQEKGSWFQRQMGKIWWLLLIIGLVAGLFIKSWIPKIPNPFKQKQDG